jgi:nucleotide-binding universal stress UspA family protein
MGYFPSLIERKFKGRTMGSYEAIRKEYADFLMTEEEMTAREVGRILLPIDYFVGMPPTELIRILSVYGAEVHIAYIIDKDILGLIDEVGGKDLRDEYQEKKEAAGMDKVARFSKRLEEEGLRVTVSLFSGSPIEDALRLAESYDIVALSRAYGAGITEKTPVSPVTVQVAQRAPCSALIY